MKIRTRYIVSVTFLYLALAVVSIAIYQVNRTLFICCEVLVVVCAILTFLFFRSFIRPFRILNAGIESISDKDFSLKFLPVGQPELDRLLDTYNRMIDQLRMERTVTSEKNFLLGKLIDASLSGMIMLNTDHLIELLNPVAGRILHRNGETFENRPVSSLPPPWGAALGSLEVNESVMVQIDGVSRYRCSRAHFHDRGLKRSFYFIEELTKELVRAERAGYEKVIRMISHEINNSVGAVNSIIDLTVKHISSEGDRDSGEFIDALQTARERMQNLNRFTSRFSEIIQIPSPESSDCDLTGTVRQILVYMKGDMDLKQIRTEVRSPTPGPVIRFDNQQLELVLVNIIKNAIEAIGREGRIRITVEESPVSMNIENNGKRITEEIRMKLFEPFFTTKKNGQGIGLTLIREILINHGCDFSLGTREDGMTEFRIVFRTR